MTTSLRQAPTLSIVVPCYNEEEALPETALRLDALLEEMIDADLVGPASHILSLIPVVSHFSVLLSLHAGSHTQQGELQHLHAPAAKDS